MAGDAELLFQQGLQAYGRGDVAGAEDAFHTLVDQGHDHLVPGDRDGRQGCKEFRWRRAAGDREQGGATLGNRLGQPSGDMAGERRRQFLAVGKAVPG